MPPPPLGGMKRRADHGAQSVLPMHFDASGKADVDEPSRVPSFVQRWLRHPKAAVGAALCATVGCGVLVAFSLAGSLLPARRDRGGADGLPAVTAAAGGPELGFPFDSGQAAALNERFGDSTADEVLRWLVAALPGRTAQFSSFGPSGLVVLDKLSKLDLLDEVTIVTIDTLHLFKETYALVNNLTKAYPKMRLRTFYPEGMVAGQSRRFDVLYGEDLWTLDFDHYTYLTKVEPTNRALREIDPRAWITGRRRSQGGERKALHVFEVDDGRIKVNPLANWTFDDVWGYIRAQGLQYNPLHDKGYASIGDQMNTRPLKPGETERAGRFMYSGNKTECGMHEHTARMDALKREAKEKKQPLKLPTLPCEECLDLTADTFEKSVLASRKPVLVEFFSPICGHCQRFAPEFEQVAATLGAEGRVTAARMDIFTYTIPKAGDSAGFKLSAYPTIYLSVLDPDKGTVSATRYPGEKKADALLAWVEEQLSALPASGGTRTSHSEN